MHFYAFYYNNYQLAIDSLHKHSVSAKITYLRVKPAQLPDVLKRHRVAFTRDRLLCVCYSSFDYDLENLSRIYGPDISFEKYDFGPAEESELMAWFNQHIQFSKKIPGGVKYTPVLDSTVEGARRQRESDDYLKKEFVSSMQSFYDSDIKPLYDLMVHTYGLRVGVTLSEIQDEWLLQNKSKMRLWARLQYEEVRLSKRGKDKKNEIEREVYEFFTQYYDYAAELIDRQNIRLREEFEAKVKAYCEKNDIPRDFVSYPYHPSHLRKFLEDDFPEISHGYAVVRAPDVHHPDPIKLFYARVEPYERHLMHINYMQPYPLPKVVPPRKMQRKF